MRRAGNESVHLSCEKALHLSGEKSTHIKTLRWFLVLEISEFYETFNDKMVKKIKRRKRKPLMGQKVASKKEEKRDAIHDEVDFNELLTCKSIGT